MSRVVVVFILFIVSVFVFFRVTSSCCPLCWVTGAAWESSLLSHRGLFW